MKRKALIGFLSVVLALGVIAVMSVVLASSKAKWPQSGSTTRDSKLKIDSTYKNDGYFMACTASSTSKKLKLRVIKGDTTLTYDLNNKGQMEVFPLQLGDGNYQITLYENISGKKYSQVGQIHVYVKLNDQNGPFLYPNQYVNYSEESEAVKKSDDLCENKADADAYKAVCAFMKKSFVYDYIKAATVKTGTLPDVDGCFKSKKGICQDLAAIMVSMLRAEGIPAKLMIGYADKTYHAWVIAIVNDEEQFFDPTAAISGGKVKKYTTERYY